jgi:pimeloyl-ACP methyl ester carboxylesterase
MKTIIFNTLIIMTGISLFTCCSSVKETGSPKSLYKTEEGRKIANTSYNRALSLCDAEYSEDFVETDFGESHLLIYGEDDAKPLILLPGLFGDASMWYTNAGELSKNYRVYALDMPNYGGKSRPSGNVVKDIDDYKLWFSQILDHYDINQVSVVGISYSSWLALTLAREMPEKISSIILLDPSETFMPMNGGIAWKGFKSFMFFPNRKKYTKFLDWLGGGYTDENLLIWREHMLDVMEYGSTKMFDVPQHRVYQPEELEMITMPVLIMAGGKPILYKDPAEFKAAALRTIPHAEVIIVPDAGHGLNMEKPVFINENIISFLKENS